MKEHLLSGWLAFGGVCGDSTFHRPINRVRAPQKQESI